jgi:hypothetical protein
MPAPDASAPAGDDDAACDDCGGAKPCCRVTEKWNFLADMFLAGIQQSIACVVRAEDFFDEDSCGLRDFL